jgi:hypothetical protein
VYRNPFLVEAMKIWIWLKLKVFEKYLTFKSNDFSTSDYNFDDNKVSDYQVKVLDENFARILIKKIQFS